MRRSPHVATVILILCFAFFAAAAPPFEYAAIASLPTTAVSRRPSVPTLADILSSVQAPVPRPDRLSSTFGPRWKASDSRDDFHRGIDYFDDLDTPIRAILDGTVFQVHTVAAGTMPGGGNVVILRHQVPAALSPGAFHGVNITTFYSYYLHLNQMNLSVSSVGSAVSRGTQIGTMGKTGDTEFIHLHFEIRLQGYCSREYQVANGPAAPSLCYTGFDPHVHPFVVLGGGAASSSGTSLTEIVAAAGFAFAVRYNATRAHMDLDVIETNYGTIVFNTREGMRTSTIAELDDVAHIAPWMSVRPGYFISTTGDSISYEFHFPQRPTSIEVRNIRGVGIRWEAPTSAAARQSELIAVIMSSLLMAAGLLM